MKRTVAILVATLAVGAALGAIGSRAPYKGWW